MEQDIPKFEDGVPLEADIEIRVSSNDIPKFEDGVAVDLPQGDVPKFEDGKPLEEATWGEKLRYGIAKGETVVGNASLWLQAVAPIPYLQITNEEGELDVDLKTASGAFGSFDADNDLYGPEWANLGVKERVEFLKNLRDQEIKTKYQDVINRGGDNSGFTTTGEVIGSMFDPTTLIPVGLSYKSMSVTAGALGASWDALSQLANKPLEEFSPVQTGVVAAGSAVAAPVLAKTVKTVGQSLSKVYKARKEQAQIKNLAAADEAVDEINTVIAQGTAKGVSFADMPAYIKTTTNLGEKELTKIIGQSSKKFHVPSQQEALKLAEIQAYQADPIGSRQWLPRIDNMLGVMHTNLKQLSAPLAARLREFEGMAHFRTAEGLAVMKPFAVGFKALPKQIKRQVSVQLANGDFDGVRAVFQQYKPDMIQHFNNVETLLQNSYANLKGVGYNVTQVPNYFPRVVKDLKSLQSKLSGKQLADVQKVWAQRAKQLNKAKLSDSEKELILSEMIQGRKISFPDDKTIIITPGAKPSGAPSATKQRILGQIDDKLLDDYADPITALHHYIRTTSQNIEKRKFFGTGRSNKDAVDIDVEDSIQRLMREEIDAGRLKGENIDEVGNLLKARFNEGEQSASGYLQTIRNTGYMTTIGDPISTLTQIGDLGLAAYYNGLGNTLKALLRKKQLSVEQLGIEDIISAEFLSSKKLSGRILDTVLTGTGFKMIDRLGKNTLINGALIKAQNLSKSAKGIAKLKEEHGDVFGKEFDQLVNDLKAGNITDNVKLYAFNALSDVQPITLSEMPVAYLQNPNGRVLYQLKSYMLKQFDLARNDIYYKGKQGKVKEATKNFAAYALIVPSMGAGVNEVKDLLLGRGFNMEEIPDNYIENVLKFLMATEYTQKQISEYGKVGEVLQDTFAGGLGVLVDNLNAVNQDANSLLSGDLEFDDSKILSRAPLIGRFWYAYLGGGLEKFQAKKFQEAFELPE